MIRNKKKHIRGNRNAENLLEAVQKIKKGSINFMDARKQYEIPSTILRNHE